MGRYTSGGIGRDIVAGALAGAAAVWLIDKMQLTLTHPRAAGREGDIDPAHQVAARAADAVGADIGDRRDNPVGHTVHYGVGIAIGAFYGLLRSLAPSVTTGRGVLYGAAAFILADEVGAPALGLAKSPFEYPARAHARGALAHTVFGFFTDLGTRLLAPWRDEVVIEYGPSLGERIEHGRHALAEGRDYLYDRGGRTIDRGRAYISDLADNLREIASEIDVSGLAERGRREVSRIVDRVRDALPDADDVADTLDRGRRRVGEMAENVQSHLPDRDDLAGMAEAGRRQGRRLARNVRSQLPDSDDVSDLAKSGRERVSRLTEEARAQAKERAGAPVSRFLKWLFG